MGKIKERTQTITFFWCGLEVDAPSTFPSTLFFSLLLCSLSTGYANTEGFLHVAMAILGA